MINLLLEELPLILLNYSEQIAVNTIIDFNFMVLFLLTNYF